MVLNEISKIFEKRKTELHSLLSERKDEIKPEQQHQMYGAMNEIEVFLRTLEYYRQKEIDKEIKNAVLVGPMIREGMVTRMLNNINHKVSIMRGSKKKG